MIQITFTFRKVIKYQQKTKQISDRLNEPPPASTKPKARRKINNLLELPAIKLDGRKNPKTLS